MKTYSLAVNPLQRVPKSWLLPLDDQEPTGVYGPISRYADLDVGLHMPEFIKQNKSWTWTSIYYYEINGAISIHVAERVPQVFYGDKERLHSIATALQPCSNDKVKIMHKTMDHNHTMLLQGFAKSTSLTSIIQISQFETVLVKRFCTFKKRVRNAAVNESLN